MLSIGKLALGQQEYYLGQVADGLEDYYTGGGEAPGEWVASSSQLGLAGDVAPDALRNLLAGVEPGGGYRLVPERSRRVAGFDLTFSAPKSVSVLWALGDPTVSVAVRDAHDAAVAAAVGFLEREGAFTRRGWGGSETLSTEGWIAASFRHRVSRNGDPQLHSHVLVANVVLGADGRWGTIDARRIYANRLAAGYLYQAQLRHELTTSLGVAWMAPVKGAAEIVGVPASLLSALSSRRAEIVEQLALAGVHGAAAARSAAVASRRAKREIDVTAARRRWAALAESHGFGPDEMRRVLNLGRPLPLTVHHAEIIADELIGPGGLTAKSSTFVYADVVRAVAERAPSGSDHQQILQLARTVLRHPGAGALNAERFSTRELLDIEQRAVNAAATRVRERDERWRKPFVRAGLDQCPTLDDEQRAMVTQLTMSGNGVDVVVAPAGCGKTFALQAAKEIWTSVGLRPRGVTLSGRAAAELYDAARIASSTFASFNIAVADDPLTSRDVVVVDEAGMVGTRTLAPLLELAALAGAKVVLVGDPHQLPEIDAGGLLRGLAERLPVIELDTNRRQRARWEREALAELRNGDLAQAIRAYIDHDRVRVSADADTARRAVVDSWLPQHLAGERSVILAERADDVAELNALARQRLVDGDLFNGPEVVACGRRFAVGDRVVALRNDYGIDLRNGHAATVTGVDPEQRTLVLQLDNGESRRVPECYLDAGHLGYAYAITVHKAQGITVDHSHLYAPGGITREHGYVAMSRGRATNEIHVVERPSREQAHALEAEHRSVEDELIRAREPKAMALESR